MSTFHEKTYYRGQEMSIAGNYTVGFTFYINGIHFYKEKWKTPSAATVAAIKVINGMNLDKPPWDCKSCDD